MNKNILKKITTLAILSATIIYSLNTLIPGNFESLQKINKSLLAKLDEADKIKLNKKIKPLSLNTTIKVNADIEIKDDLVLGELLVKFKDLTQKESFVRENVGEFVVSSSLVTQLSIPITGDEVQDRKDTLELVNQLKSDSRIAWAEPNLIARRSFVPNDSKYNDQWALKNTGQPNLAYYNPYPTTIIQPTPGFDIKAEQAWDISTGNSTVIAILDDGIDYSHPDLLPNIYRDSGGRIIGKNIGDNCFYSNNDGTDNTTCNYKTIPLDPNYGHGTSVAGAAAAKGNNATGISGACPNCKIMPIGLEGLAGASTFNTINIYNGMVYAINNGAKIINLSLGYDTFVQSISNLVDIAYDNNIVVVASSGNCGLAINSPSTGCTTQNQLEYPASYPKVISVSGTNPDGKKADFATVNSLVDVAGPARNIWTTWSQYTTSACGSGAIVSGNSTLCYESGTSFSAPLTSGVLGLMFGQNPTYTSAQVETALKNGTTNVYLLNPTFFGLMGSGNINACGALVGCNPNPASSSAVSSLSNSSQSNTLSGNINLNICQSSTASTVLNLSPNIATNELNLVSQNVPSGFFTSSSNTTGHLDITYYPSISNSANLGIIAGTYKLVVQEANNAGNVGSAKEYNLIFTVINCSSSSSSISVSSAQSSSSAATSTPLSSIISSSSVIASSSQISSSNLISSSSLIATSVSSSSSLITSSSSNQVSSSSVQYSFGSFLPNAPLIGVVGSTFPTFSLNGCNLLPGPTPVTMSSGVNSIGGTITNCVFTPNNGSTILAAFGSINILYLNGAGVLTITIPTNFTLPIVSSSSLISSSISSSSVSSSSRISSSSTVLPSVQITNVSIVGSQFQITFVPNNYVPTLGGIHTHFYYNTELNTVVNKMYSGSSPYFLDLSTKPLNATQICSIVANPDHTVLAGSGNCFTLPIQFIGSSSQVISSSALLASSITSSIVLSSSSLSTSSLMLVSSSLASSSISYCPQNSPICTCPSGSEVYTPIGINGLTGVVQCRIIIVNNAGGTINISNNIPISSSRIAISSTISSSQQIFFSSSLQSLTFKQINEFKTETKLESKDDKGNKAGDIVLNLEGQGECSKPLEAIVKTAKEQNIKDGNNIYPYGVLNFKVKCDAEVKVKIFYPGIKDWKEWQVRKLIFDKDNLKYNWKDFVAELGFENNLATISYTIKDGEYGDSTAKDGYIIDPIGLIKRDNLAPSTNIAPVVETAQKSTSTALDLVLPRTGGVNIMNSSTFITILVMLAFILRAKENKE